MSFHSTAAAGITCLVLALTAHGEIRALIERNEDGGGFTFQQVPSPARDDAATTAEFRLLGGELDRNGGSLEVLHDGKLPTGEDQPDRNFFFQAGTVGGRLRIDLGGVKSVKQVNTYSWHANSRGPQVYRLYGADGEGVGFQPAPDAGSDPASCGWRLLARVDTRPSSGDPAGSTASR